MLAGKTAGSSVSKLTFILSGLVKNRRGMI